MSKDLNIYDLMRNWFDFCFENPEKINTSHSALYFFALSHCNRLGWKRKFGLPTTMTMEAIGIKSFNTYIKCFKDLNDFGFIEVIEKSKNQYSSNIIALSNFDKATNKALDKASTKHLTKQLTKQSESTIQSKCTVDIPIHNNTNTQIHQLTNTQKENLKENFPNEKIKKEKPKIETLQIINPFVDELFIEHWEKWKTYKIKEKNFKWKSDISEGVSIKKLFKDSNGNLNLAILMIENAIANGYSGIFPIKNQNLNNQHGTQKQNASEQFEQFKRNLDAKYATENQSETPDFEDGGYAEDVDS